MVCLNRLVVDELKSFTNCALHSWILQQTKKRQIFSKLLQSSKRNHILKKLEKGVKFEIIVANITSFYLRLINIIPKKFKKM